MRSDTLLTKLHRIKNDILNNKEPSAYTALLGLIEEVEDEIRDICNKASGKGSVADAAKRVLKRAGQHHIEAHHKAYRGDKGLLVCDGAQALRFNLDTAPSLVEHPAGYDYHDYPNIDRIIDGSKGNDVPVDVPNLEELRAVIRIAKAKHNVPRGGGAVFILKAAEQDIRVDAQLLADMLEALPGATVTAARQKAAISALYFKAENGDGILLPIRPTE
jgi:hypothetical protein